MSLHTSVADLAQQRGLADDAEQKSNVHFLHIAPDAPETRVRVGDIVQLVWQRKRLYGHVKRWNGNLDSHVVVLDLRAIPHNRYVDSLTHVTDPDERAAVSKQFEELFATKKGLAALKPAVRLAPMDAPESGRGQPQRCDIPYVLRDRLHAAWPAPALIEHALLPSDRLVIARERDCPRLQILERERRNLRAQPQLMSLLGIAA